MPKHPDATRAALIAAALRYVAIADWFERRPITRDEKRREGEAMDTFNRAEEELRVAGRQLLGRGRQRALVLENALQGNTSP